MNQLTDLAVLMAASGHNDADAALILRQLEDAGWRLVAIEPTPDEQEKPTQTTLADWIANAVLGTLPDDVEPATLWMAVSLAMNLVLHRIPMEKQTDLDRVAFVKAILMDGPVSDVTRALAPSTKPAEQRQDQTLYCSFCGKSQHEVRKLIAGPTQFICDECIELCMDIITLPDAPDHQDH